MQVMDLTCSFFYYFGMLIVLGYCITMYSMEGPDANLGTESERFKFEKMEEERRISYIMKRKRELELQERREGGGGDGGSPRAANGNGSGDPNGEGLRGRISAQSVASTGAKSVQFTAEAMAKAQDKLKVLNPGKTASGFNSAEIREYEHAIEVLQQGNALKMNQEEREKFYEFQVKSTTAVYGVLCAHVCGFCGQDAFAGLQSFSDTLGYGVAGTFAYYLASAVPAP